MWLPKAKAKADIRCHACVIAIGIAATAQTVDEAFRHHPSVAPRELRMAGPKWLGRD